MSASRIEGLAEALEGLNEEISRIKDATQAAFWEAGLLIIGESQRRAPVDTGNLRGSAYVRSNSGVQQPSPESFSGAGSVPTDLLPEIGVEVGYYANYAMAVHEMVGQKLKGQPRSDFGSTRGGTAFGGGTGSGSYWDTGEPKFLESVVVNNIRVIPEIIRKRTEMDKVRDL